MLSRMAASSSLIYGEFGYRGIMPNEFGEGNCRTYIVGEFYHRGKSRNSSA